MAGDSKAVIDASLVLAWLMPDEREEAVNRIFKNKGEFFAPKLLVYELLSGLRTAVLRKRISWPEVKKSVSLFRQTGFHLVDQAGDEEEILRLAQRLNLSVYDAAYAVLAKKLKVKLLSLDKKLAKL